MENHSLAHRYREVAVRTANPMQLVVILYDAAICSLQEARDHIQGNNIAGRSRSINKCLSIISELQSSLDMKAGGDIADSLNRIYDYLRKRIFAAGAQQCAQPLEEAEALLEKLRSAWRTLAEQAGEPIEAANRQGLPDHAVIGVSATAAAMQLKPFSVSI